MSKTVMLVLIGTSNDKDADGYLLRVQRERRRTVFAEEVSAIRSEFYTAMKAGRRISHVLKVRVEAYCGEQYAEFMGKRYEILRNYTKSGGWYELSLAEVV